MLTHQIVRSYHSLKSASPPGWHCTSTHIHKTHPPPHTLHTHTYTHPLTHCTSTHVHKTHTRLAAVTSTMTSVSRLASRHCCTANSTVTACKSTHTHTPSHTHPHTLHTPLTHYTHTHTHTLYTHTHPSHTIHTHTPLTHYTHTLHPHIRKLIDTLQDSADLWLEYWQESTCQILHRILWEQIKRFYGHWILHFICSTHAQCIVKCRESSQGQIQLT